MRIRFMVLHPSEGLHRTLVPGCPCEGREGIYCDVARLSEAGREMVGTAIRPFVRVDCNVSWVALPLLDDENMRRWYDKISGVISRSVPIRQESISTFTLAELPGIVRDVFAHRVGDAELLDGPLVYLDEPVNALRRYEGLRVIEETELYAFVEVGFAEFTAQAAV